MCILNTYHWDWLAKREVTPLGKRGNLDTRQPGNGLFGGIHRLKTRLILGRPGFVALLVRDTAFIPARNSHIAKCLGGPRF